MKIYINLKLRVIIAQKGDSTPFRLDRANTMPLTALSKWKPINSAGFQSAWNPGSFRYLTCYVAIDILSGYFDNECFDLS